MLVHYGKLIPKNENYIKKISILDQIKEAGKTYNPFRNLFIRHYLKCVDRIFAVSNSLKELLAINGIKNVETIYNGIDVNDWVINNEEIKKIKEKYNLQNKKIIFFGGRLSGAKGGKQILKVMALIKKEINDVVLLIAGEKNKYVNRMEKMIEELNIENNIILIGWLEKKELKAVYNSVDLCVFPSLCFETFGMMVLEAMACKKPVISSCFGGPREMIIDGETGYLVNPNDTELMAEKIIDLLKNSQKAKQFGEAGYARAKKHFSSDEQINKTLEWYKKYV